MRTQAADLTPLPVPLPVPLPIDARVTVAVAMEVLNELDKNIDVFYQRQNQVLISSYLLRRAADADAFACAEVVRLTSLVATARGRCEFAIESFANAQLSIDHLISSIFRWAVILKCRATLSSVLCAFRALIAAAEIVANDTFINKCIVNTVRSNELHADAKAVLSTLLQDCEPFTSQSRREISRRRAVALRESSIADEDLTTAERNMQKGRASAAVAAGNLLLSQNSYTEAVTHYSKPSDAKKFLRQHAYAVDFATIDLFMALDKVGEQRKQLILAKRKIFVTALSQQDKVSHYYMQREGGSGGGRGRR